jgi:hypothetical protein
MILDALNAKGGQKWLAQQARENPVGFMMLLGKVLPMQVSGTASEEIKICMVNPK